MLECAALKASHPLLDVERGVSDEAWRALLQLAADVLHDHLHSTSSPAAAAAAGSAREQAAADGRQALLLLTLRELRAEPVGERTAAGSRCRDHRRAPPALAQRR